MSPFIVIAAIVGIIISVASAKSKSEQQKRAANSTAARKQAMDALDEASRRIESARSEMNAAKGESEAERKQRQEELKRRLEANAERRRLERESLEKTVSARPMDAKPAQAGPVSARAEKPVAAHTDEDCGGGSIHDGYHEGVTQFSADRPAAVAGRLGHRLADEDDAKLREQIAAENAQRAINRISKLPPLAQGMVWSEILGKPKSETA